jgi:hypothetical protein
MSNNIIYPILIIIFSILIIYAIINTKNIEKFNNSVSPIVNYQLYKNESILKANASHNTQFTLEMINGNWTCDLTTVDSNYVASNLITINANASTDSNNGTLTYNNNTYNITFLLNQNLNAVLLDSSTGQPTTQYLHIKFYNNFTDNKNINPPFQKPEEFNSVVSIYSNDVLINKFASYKVYGTTVGEEVYRIILSSNFYLERAPPVYDFKSYDKIIGQYQFPSNYLTLSFGVTNSNILNTINTKYKGNIKFEIQRVFYSPTNINTEIKTGKSSPIMLNVVSNNQIPNIITVSSFKNDQITNNLDSFFKPKATILYFYKSINTSATYQFTKPNINESNAVLKIKNNANAIAMSNIEYSDLSSIEQVITNTYMVTYVNVYNSNLSDVTNINFSDLYNLL